MRNIEVAVIDNPINPGGTMMFLAKLTQRGHNINSMEDLLNLKAKSQIPSQAVVETVAALPHGTIKRFTPITVAIVGASRRFLAQARTHQVGFNYVSASLQYSNYTDKGQFVVPYALLEADATAKCIKIPFGGFDDAEYCKPSELYLRQCNEAMKTYKLLADTTDNDTAGYAAPQGLRNILVMQGNHEAWMNFIRLRSCNRNTNETQYVTLKIWEELLKTPDGEEMFRYAGPDCMFGPCREGKMACGNPLRKAERQARMLGIATPRYIMDEQWSLLKE